MRKLFITLAIIFPLTSFAENDFLGTYQCKGTDPYLKKDYKGTVIVKQQNTVYSIVMNYDTGENYMATGGQYNPTLMSVVFQDKKNLKRVGLEQYALSDDKKTMRGYWVYLGQDKLGREICERE